MGKGVSDPGRTGQALRETALGLCQLLECELGAGVYAVSVGVKALPAQGMVRIEWAARYASEWRGGSAVVSREEVEARRFG